MKTPNSHRAARCGLSHLPTKPANDAPNFLRSCAKSLKTLRFDVPDIQRNIKLGTHFGTRPFGDRKEILKFSPAGTVEALRNVGHDRNSSASHLIPQCKIAIELFITGNAIHLPRKFARFLPGDQILKLRHFCHGPRPTSRLAIFQSVSPTPSPSNLEPRTSQLSKTLAPRTSHLAPSSCT